MEKRDNVLLIAGIVGVVFWLKMASSIPSFYADIYFLCLFVLLIPFVYLLYLKKRVYHWSWEAIFYLFLLTFGGILSFAYSILGLEPLEVLRGLS